MLDFGSQCFRLACVGLCFGSIVCETHHYPIHSNMYNIGITMFGRDMILGEGGGRVCSPRQCHVQKEKETSKNIRNYYWELLDCLQENTIYPASPTSWLGDGCF